MTEGRKLDLEASPHERRTIRNMYKKALALAAGLPPEPEPDPEPPEHPEVPQLDYVSRINAKLDAMI